MIGFKTYIVAAGFVVMGIAWIVLDGQATFANPTGDTEAIMRRVVGWIAILLGGAVAALRHGMKTSADRIIRSSSLDATLVVGALKGKDGS